MKLLECLALLDFALESLHAGKRVPVPIGAYYDLVPLLIPLSKKLGTLQTSSECRICLQQLEEAVNLVQFPVGSVYLPDAARDTLVSGINSLRDAICLEAFEYFKWNDFEPTPEVVKIMKSVVQVALRRGVI